MGTLIRVLLVDHSVVFREILRKRFLNHPQIKMLPAATDPFDALHKVNKYRPDVIICENELPYFTGTELISKHLRKYNIPIIAMSLQAELEEAALQAGARAFVVKPSAATHDEALSFTSMLLELALQIGQRELHGKPQLPIRQNYYNRRFYSHRNKVIAIGASTSNNEDIVQLLSSLPSNSPPVLLLHQTDGKSQFLVERLKAACAMTVKEADEGECLLSGTIMVATSDRSLRLHSDDHYYYVTEGKQHEKPMDDFFDSVAVTMGSDAIGILLAGTEDDGVSGLQKLGQAGAHVFIRKEQDMLDEQNKRKAESDETTFIAAIQSTDDLTKQLLYSI